MNRPLAGIGTIDATVTGNRRELQATGTFAGAGIKYGENGALALSADYTVRAPELSAVDASVTANSHATFATIAGQNINELDAKTDYQQKQLGFNATAKQPQRSLQASGSLLVHPDHQEVHLREVALQTAGMTWQLAPGTMPAIRYAGDAVAVENLRLANGNQQIAADGSFGRPEDALKVTLSNVDLAAVDALLLRAPQFSGRINATSTISGSREAPHVNADFNVTQGAFRNFHYESFGGTLNYTGVGVTVDSKLQQNPSTWIEAKGYLPMAVFAARGAAYSETAHNGAVPPGERIDFHIRSSPIDLGLVQGLTTAVTNVSGTLQANVDITGSAADPHPLGAITMQNGAFIVEATGVGYTHAQGQIDLQPDRLHITHISVLDNHQSSLSVTGELAIHERQVGGVQLYVTGNDFKVVDNQIGNVRVNSDLQIVGELRGPTLQGELGVSTGQLNLDEILALTDNSAYATEPTEYLTKPANSNTPPPPPGIFDALKVDVHLTAPDDLVVRGQDLRAPGSPIGLGAMTVTLGGDVRATKDPGLPIQLVGVVNTVRGTYDFQGRRFDILRDGSVRFQGDSLNDLNPSLDIRTSRIIRAVEARVNVRGTLKQPEIVLSSTPPLDQADIMSLIVFNQPLNQLGEGQQVSLAARAQELATGAVAGELARSIGNALNLDTFEISTAPEGGGFAQLTVGQQIGQNLYVKVEQSIGDQSQTNFILEYDLAKWLRLQTNVVQGSATQQHLFQRLQGSGVDLLFFFSY